MTSIFLPGPGALPVSDVIGTQSLEAIGSQFAVMQRQSGAPSSAVWPAANRAYGYPFFLTEPRKLLDMYVLQGAANSGVFDCGIYDASGARIVASAGNIAGSATNDYQTVAMTDTWLPPYVTLYAWLAFDNTTAQVMRYSAGVNLGQFSACGVLQASSALSSGALVATLTPAQLATNFLPEFGMIFAAVY